MSLPASRRCNICLRSPLAQSPRRSWAPTGRRSKGRRTTSALPDDVSYKANASENKKPREQFSAAYTPSAPEIHAALVGSPWTVLLPLPGERGFARKEIL